MRYSIWSNGTLVGHTELDVECINENLRMGFVEPAEEGRQALLDATGVHAVCARRPSRPFRDPDPDDEHGAEFEDARVRREALNLELRDENGDLFPCAFMRIYDGFLEWPETADDYDPLDDPDLDPEERERLEEFEADFNAWVDELEEERKADAWKRGYEEPDLRWETMQYTIQVFLREDFGPIHEFD
ncbi:MAG TPA: hypothetical protein VN706_19960 [Gemmatimonadaceae bacterium]|nr:hypothetical protein [Gemmatimonadaceae bacterium]